jgi:SPP1 gp7 family putative phage head morphogenesis protein
MAVIAVRNQVQLERLKTGEAAKFDLFLRDMDRVIREALAGDNVTAFRRARLESLLADVDAQLAKIQGDYWSRLKADVTDIADYQAAFEVRAISKATKGVFESVLPSPAQIRTAVFTNPLSLRGPDGGKLLEPFVKGWSESERSAFVGTIRRGYFEGQTNGQIVQAVRGTRAAGYKDGLLQMTKRHADAVVRTAVQHAAQQARAETWKANADLSTDYEWISTLDARTCPICRPLDRKVFASGKGPQPPVHPQCRCTTIIKLPSKFDFLDAGATRASVNGPVNADLTYYQWLKQQPAEFQDEVIGPNRGKLLRNGGLSAERFAALQLSRNYTPLTLAQMKAIEPLAFLKAGL